MVRWIQFFSFLVLGLLLYFAISLWFIRGEAPKPTSSQKSEIFKLTKRPESPTLGVQSSPIVVQVFSSYSCPACKEAAATIQQLEQLHPGEVLIVYRDYPLDTSDARLLAQAGRCAQSQGAFWQYHDALFSRQGQLVTEQSLISLAQSQDLRVDDFQKCLTENETVPLIEQDIADGTNAGVSSLPAFDVNNSIRIEGSVPLSQWQTIISDLKKS